MSTGPILVIKPGQQPARTDEIDAVGTRPLHQLLSQRPIRPPLLPVVVRWLNHHHILVCHCLSFPASKPLTVSGQTRYTADLTVPDAAFPRPALEAVPYRHFVGGRR
jgi:hypothetical protein